MLRSASLSAPKLATGVHEQLASSLGQAAIRGKYEAIPRDLFFILKGPRLRLLANTQASLADGGIPYRYDVIVDEHGIVNPLPDTEGIHCCSNGLLLRPNTFFMQQLIRETLSRRPVIFKLEKGLELQDRELACVWKHSDSYALQTTKPIKLSRLNKKLRQLFKEHAQSMTVSEFCDQYPFLSATDE